MGKVKKPVRKLKALPKHKNYIRGFDELGKKAGLDE